MAKIYDSYIIIQKFKSKNLPKNRNSKKTKGCRRKNYSLNGQAIKKGGGGQGPGHERKKKLF